MTPSHTRANIIWHEELDSTNSELRRHISEFDNLSAVACVGQKSGRGQGDHTWFSTPGKNLTFSILYRHEGLEAGDAILITCVTTLAIRDYLLSHGIEARIKWPNDIWVGDRKICGILIENIIEGPSIKESIVGIGLNLNEENWPGNLPNPVSLKELTGATYSPSEELEKLHDEICRRFALMSSADGRLSLQEEFGKYMFRIL
ncbi:MAG: biotin--[acetyl-CoA-carboxylase] ligase [Bacteroidales bacterium]|nr:biotin--[acetyl-CoA-carboxylase] ligase [Bacteroidales bacterium]